MSAPDKVSEKSLEGAKAFLSAVFMGLRTLQIHDANNRAVENAVRTAYDASTALYAATGGFKIQFVDATVFLNGARVRFDTGMFQSIRVLEAALRSKQVGGFAMSVPPSFDAIRTLITELAKEGDVEHGRLATFNIGALGLQSFADATNKVSVDRRVLAVHNYAKLILSLREQFERVRKERREGRSSPIRLRVVRVLQDLVEMAADRPDLLLRLSTNLSGAASEELYGVNTALLAIVMGQALGLDRRDLVDIGMGALFHHLGATTPTGPLDRAALDASAARMFAEGGVSRSSLLRSVVVAHARKRADGRSKFREGPPHLFVRIAAVASAYGQLVAGYGTQHAYRARPLDALQILMQDISGRFDADLVDLAINVLRAYPVGCHVVLDTGEHAIVTTHLGSSRWDRPVVAVKGDGGRNLDLMIAVDGKFEQRIAATARHVGRTHELTEVEKLLPLRAESVAGRLVPGDMPLPEPSTPVEAAVLLDAVIAEEARVREDPGEGAEMDELFREFLAEDKKKKPKIDTSYSSRTKGDQD